MELLQIPSDPNILFKLKCEQLYIKDATFENVLYNIIL